jgi:hypothetical protein
MVKRFSASALQARSGQVAGRIESLDYDQEGQLRIRAYVDHPLASRCGAFSIRGRIVAYELREVDNQIFHALVTHAELTEISLVEQPAIRSIAARRSTSIISPTPRSSIVIQRSIRASRCSSSTSRRSRSLNACRSPRHPHAETKQRRA